MALVSPGISITVSDQSQSVAANIGSVPLVLLATAQDKTYNGSAASGTSKANAGKLLSFTSQRDLVTQMGTPSFQVSAAGTPVNGSEINEYGLLAAYSALGLSNQLFAIRADIDLDQLTGTSVRPDASPADGTYWLDTVNTQWGIEVLNATTSSFNAVKPLIITDDNQVFDDSNYSYSVPTPLNSVGSIGQYALVFVDIDGSTANVIRLFYKAGPANYGGLNNSWVQVGSTNWQNATPAAVGTTVNPTITASSTCTINGITVTTSGTYNDIGHFASSINSANIPGVKATVVNGFLNLFVTSLASSTNSTADGKLSILDGTHSPLYAAGLVTAATSGTATAYSPTLFYGNFAQAPSGGWFDSDAKPRPSGSIWWKTSSTGSGYNPVLYKFSSDTGTFVPHTAPMYLSYGTAIATIDPTGGGVNIPAGQVIATFYVTDTTANNLAFSVQGNAKSTVAVSGTGTGSLTVGDRFVVLSTQPGSNGVTSTTVTMTGTTLTSFVSDVLAANIPYVTAAINSSGKVTITHTTGGFLSLTDITNTPLEFAGFSQAGLSTGGSGFVQQGSTMIASNWTNIDKVINFQASAPFADPETGTYWYFSEPAEVDIMINDGTGWKGYCNVSNDVRGYNLANTDPKGVIVSANTPPTSQFSGQALVKGDLWLDSGDLANYPALYRYNGSAWTAIDNTDHVSGNGIIFADARWDSAGTTNVVTGSFPDVGTLATSNYIDLDAPDYRLYARGVLLFNTRRSGYNVKKFVKNYFNATSFPNLPTVPGTASSLPAVTDAWVTASGLNQNGVMNAGAAAQRFLVVDALEAALSSNLDVTSSIYKFNLITAPGYPELIPNMVTLNNNRGDTAFIIGDTPMSLAPSSMALSNYVNDTNGDGLPQVASPYLAIYYPAGLTNDLAGNQVVVPASHAALRTYLYNDQVAYPWFAPAGVNRGLVDNLSDIGFIDSTTGGFVHNAINQGLRDALFTLNVNPITILPGTGMVVFGQLTRSGDTSARSRVNVVRLENYLRTIFASVSNGYLFEPNDQITRKSIARQIEIALNNILSLRGIYDYLVVCDSSNNTPFTIANNQLIVDVAIEPERDVEFIYIPISIFNPGAIAALGATST